MTEQHGAESYGDGQWIVVPREQRMAQMWWLVLALGILALGLGLLLALWPGETLRVVAFLLAFQLVVGGSAQMLTGLVSTSLHGWARAAVVLASAAAVVVGALLMFEPLQTLDVVSFLVGGWLLLNGVADMVTARLLVESRGRRVWDVVRGIVSLAVGLFLVLDPERSLGFVVLLSCIWLVSHGVLTILAALDLRAKLHAT